MYTRITTSENTREVKTFSHNLHKKSVKRQKLNMLYALVNGISIFLLVWLIASYIDVMCNNMSTYSYAWWNLIEIFIKIF